MIYVWAMEQKNRHFEKQDVLVPWNRALCSQLLSEPSHSMEEQRPTHTHRHQPCPRPCSHRSCAVGSKERWDAKRSHSMDSEPFGAANCCAIVSKKGVQENGFYNTLGKSFRSWFSSRSLDESTLRKQIERVRPWKTTEGWASSTISIQPSRHAASLESDHSELLAIRGTTDEDVFVETSSKQLEWLRAPATTKHLNGDHQEDVKRNGDGNILQSSDSCGACIKAEGNPVASKIRRRISTSDSTDSNPDDSISIKEQQPDILEATAFMRYYHVFREGELCDLLKEHVSELRILSSGNDHGNWCIVAEKRGKQNCD